MNTSVANEKSCCKRKSKLALVGGLVLLFECVLILITTCSASQSRFLRYDQENQLEKEPVNSKQQQKQQRQSASYAMQEQQFDKLQSGDTLSLSGHSIESDDKDDDDDDDDKDLPEVQRQQQQLQPVQQQLQPPQPQSPQTQPPQQEQQKQHDQVPINRGFWSKLFGDTQQQQQDGASQKNQKGRILKSWGIGAGGLMLGK